MKKIIILLSMVLISTAAQSQVLISLLLGDKLNAPGLEFGLEGGYNRSTLTGMESSSGLSTFALGFYFDIRLKNQWYLNTGVMVKSKQGLAKLSQNDLDFLQADIYEEAGDYDQVINYFLVPALIRYKFKNHLYVEAGPQAGLRHKAYVEYNSDVEGKKARVREYNDDMIQRLDGGLMAGMGYILKKGTGMTLGIKYYYGLAGVYKDKSGTKNRYFLLKFNVPIGAGEKAEKN